MFRILLYLGQEFTRLRENQRDAWHQILAIMRKVVLKTGDLLVCSGRLKDRNDIFYISRNEFWSILEGKNQLPIKIDDSKKAEFNSSSQTVSQSPIQMNNSNILHGIGVSRGHAVGRVRIAENYEQALKAQYGDILVTHSVDPAWSPVFNVLTGLIMETGGILSHASIIAREYGLPTVTSVQHATSLFKTGEIIELCGERGMIKRYNSKKEYKN